MVIRDLFSRLFLFRIAPSVGMYYNLLHAHCSFGDIEAGDLNASSAAIVRCSRGALQMLRGQIKPSFRERKKVNDTFDNQIVKVVANKEESDEIWQKSKKEKPKTCMKVKVRVKVMRGSRRERSN